MPASSKKNKPSSLHLHDRRGLALRKLKITADERMNVPQKCTIGVRWLATARTYPFLLIYLTILSVPMFWSSIPSLF